MNIDSISAWCIFAGYIPFLAIIVILLHYSLRRFLWRLRKRQGKSNLGFYPTSFALGMALQFMQVYWRPSVSYVLEEKQDEDADEDDNGDPETLNKQLSRQLKRIRRGEPVEPAGAAALSSKVYHPDVFPANGRCKPFVTPTIYTGKRRFLCFLIKFLPRFLAPRTSGRSSG